MKIAIATPEQMGFSWDGKSTRFPGWTLFPTDFQKPSEIRARIHALIQDEDADDTGETEHLLVTMNRSVLDLVTHHNVKTPGPMDYEDVFFWSDEKGDLVPLLDLHSEEWLVHFALGDVIDREL